MTDRESERRTAAQRRALQVHPQGARVDAVYVNREQEYVPVSRTDLKDFMEIDGTALWLLSAGSFFASGAFWLFAEHQFEIGMAWDMQQSFCLLSILFGAVLAIAGWRMHLMKRRRIEAVFERREAAKG